MNQSRLHKLIILLAVNINCLLFCLSSDTLFILAISLPLSVFSLLKPSLIQVTTRSIVYSLVCSFSLSIILGLFIKIEDRFFLTPAESFFPVLVYIMLLFSLLEKTPRVNLSISLMVILSLMLAGDVNLPMRFHNLSIPKSWGSFSNYHQIYIGVTALQAPFILYLIYQSLPKHKTVLKARRRILKFSLQALCVFLVPLSIPFLKGGLIPLSRASEDLILRHLTQHRQPSSLTDKDLNLASHNFPDINDPRNSVLLEVEADFEPGYLRQQIYANYQNGRWIKAKDGQKLRVHLSTSEELTSINFIRDPRTIQDFKESHQQKLYYSSNLKTKYLIHHANTALIEAITTGLEKDINGSIFFRDADLSGSVILHNQLLPPKVPLNEAEKIRYLQVPKNIIHALEYKVINILGTFPENLSEAEIINRIVKFFHQNYKYRYGVQLQKFDENNAARTDPALSFLNQRTKEGHCEYFANSCTLLLRTAGIPARMVTGFHCAEKHPYAKRYIARSNDLHAWVEAHTANGWVNVEATPPQARPTSKTEFSLLDSTLNSVTHFFKSLYAKVLRGEAAIQIIFFLKSAWKETLMTAQRPLRLALIVILLYGFLQLKRYRHRKFFQRLSPKQKVTWSLQGEILKLQHVLEKKYHFPIHESCTLKEMQDFIAALPTAHDELLDALKHYELLRFTSTEKEDFKEIKRTFKFALKKLIRERKAYFANKEDK